jgi:hypothetical protein
MINDIKNSFHWLNLKFFPRESFIINIFCEVCIGIWSVTNCQMFSTEFFVAQKESKFQKIFPWNVTETRDILVPNINS